MGNNLATWTFCLAVLGATLGVLNTWMTFIRGRVRLMVAPLVCRFRGDHWLTSRLDNPPDFNEVCLEITNLSGVAITVSSVGFLKKKKGERWHIPRPIMADGGTFPRRLEPRHSFTVYTSPGLGAEAARMSRIAFAETDCGVLAVGTSVAYRKFGKALRLKPANRASPMNAFHP